MIDMVALTEILDDELLSGARFVGVDQLRAFAHSVRSDREPICGRVVDGDCVFTHLQVEVLGADSFGRNVFGVIVVGVGVESLALIESGHRSVGSRSVQM